MSCSFITTLKSLWSIHNNPVAIVVDCSKMSRSDEPRGEPSLLGLPRGEDASRRKPRSELHKKLCTATRERLSLDCGAKLRSLVVVVKKRWNKAVLFHLFFFRHCFRSFLWAFWRTWWLTLWICHVPYGRPPTRNLSLPDSNQHPLSSRIYRAAIPKRPVVSRNDRYGCEPNILPFWFYSKSACSTHTSCKA